LEGVADDFKADEEDEVVESINPRYQKDRQWVKTHQPVIETGVGDEAQ
jgi:hypothetical protein